jgi:SAM-dependent methyltransferase
VQGYENNTYGDAFADVYDDWYADVSDVDATVERLAALVADRGATAAADGDPPVLELGVGTGRLAIPLANRISPTRVVGVDSSAAMLARLAAKQDGVDPVRTVEAVHGDMVDGLPSGPFGVVFVAFNTFFNLATAERQEACVRAVASRLAPGGLFVVEADVPEQAAQSGSHVEVRSVAADRVVLSVARYKADENIAEGQFIEFSEAGGVRLRPRSIRSVAPGDLDAMARAAGLDLTARWENFAMSPFSPDSGRHVSVYAMSPARVSPG